MNANPASFFFFCRILSYMERKEKSSGEKRENPDSRLFDCGSPADVYKRQVLRRFDGAVVDLGHDGVEGQDHKGQVIIYHAQNHRTLGVDPVSYTHLQRPRCGFCPQNP